MLRDPIPRLLRATGAACALSATAMLAGAAVPALAGTAAPAPASPWSGPIGPLPRAFTNAAPALAPVSFPGSAARGLLVAWKGQVAGRVFYETRPSLRAGRWSARHSIPLARTSRAPSVAAYTDPNGRHAELAVWKGRGNRRIWYSQGETRRDGTVSWTVPRSLPRSFPDRTGAAPAVFFPFDRYVAVVAWKGPRHHVRYTIGTPGRPARGFRWSVSHRIPGAVTRTGPAIAEVQTGTAKGTVYVLWRGSRTGRIRFATTPDPLTTAHGLSWTVPAAVPGAVTGATPAASAIGAHGRSPLLVAYKAPHSVHVRYQLSTRPDGARRAGSPGLAPPWRRPCSAASWPRLARQPAEASSSTSSADLAGAGPGTGRATPCPGPARGEPSPGCPSMSGYVRARYSVHERNH